MKSDSPHKYYVYALIDPRNAETFYIGKGCGRRAWQHLYRHDQMRASNTRKSKRIMEIQDAGSVVQVEFLAMQLSEHEAYRREREYIAAARKLKQQQLTNLSHGQQTELERCWHQINWLLAHTKTRAQWAVDWERRQGRPLTDDDHKIYDDVLEGHLEVRAWIARAMKSGWQKRKPRSQRKRRLTP